ncbi:MAG: hypothetical protein GOV15_00970, partial [Candidatus Diapherotrites archaeon]|nr:hypothetical protein [Candidatus Diapherotrites archaeon]
DLKADGVDKPSESQVKSRAFGFLLNEGLITGAQAEKLWAKKRHKEMMWRLFGGKEVNFKSKALRRLEAKGLAKKKHVSKAISKAKKAFGKEGVKDIAQKYVRARALGDLLIKGQVKPEDLDVLRDKEAPRIPWDTYIPMIIRLKKGIFKKNKVVWQHAFESGVKNLRGVRSAIDDLQSKGIPVKVHTTDEASAQVMSDAIGADGFRLKFFDPTLPEGALLNGVHVDDFEWIGDPNKYFEWYKDHMGRTPNLPKMVIDWGEPPTPTDTVFNIDGKHIIGKRRKEATEGIFKIWVWNPDVETFKIRETGTSKTLTHLLRKVIKPRYLDGTFERYHHEAMA